MQEARSSRTSGDYYSGHFVDINVFACPLLSNGAAFIDWELSSIGFPLLDCANQDIDWGLFGDEFFETYSIKKQYLRKWEVHASWESILNAADNCELLVLCMGLRNAYGTSKMYFDEILRSHVGSVTRTLHVEQGRYQASNDFMVTDYTRATKLN